MIHGGRYVHRTIDYPQSVSGQKFSLTGADVCPTHSPVTGKPLVIDRIVMVCQFTGSVAVTAVAGEDVPRCAQRVELTQVDKVVRVNALDGDQLRIAAMEQAGMLETREHAGWAIGALSSTEVQIPINLTTPLAFAPDDTALMPAAIESLKWQGVTTGTTGPCVAGGTLTFTSANWYLLVECREVDYIVNGPVAAWQVWDMRDQANYRIPLDGAIPAAVLIHRRCATTGGGSLTTASITQLSVDEYGRIQFTPSDLRGIYERERQVARGGLAQGTTGDSVWDDPMLSNVIPICYASQRQRSVGRPLRSFQLRTLPSGAYSDLTLLTRTILPRHDGLADELERVYCPSPDGRSSRAGGKPAHGGWFADTAGRVRSAPAGWQGQFVPMRANLTEFRRK